MKKSLGAQTLLYPCPAVVVGSYDACGKPNIMTAAWCGIVNSNPPSISVSLRKARYSYSSLIKRQAFTVNIPSEEHVCEVDYVGTLSGKNTDKFAQTGLTPVRGEKADAPYVAEFPLVMECRLIKHEELGAHTIFIGEIQDVKVEEACLNQDGKPDTAKIKPFAYIPGEGVYYGLGEYLGRAFSVYKKIGE